MASDTSGVKLPHLDILNREPTTERHTDTVTCIHQRIGRTRVDTASTSRRKYRCLCFDVNRFARLNTYRNNTHHRPVLVFHKIHDKPLRQKRGPGPQVCLVQRM